MSTKAKHSSMRRRDVASATTDATTTDVTVRGLMSAGTMQWAHQIRVFHAAWQQEWLGFVSHRLSRAATFMQQLAACKGPEQVARTCADFCQHTIDDYQSELATLAQLGTEMTGAAVPVAPNGHNVRAPQEREMRSKQNA